MTADPDDIELREALAKRSAELAHANPAEAARVACELQLIVAEDRIALLEKSLTRLIEEVASAAWDYDAGGYLFKGQDGRDLYAAMTEAMEVIKC